MKKKKIIIIAILTSSFLGIFGCIDCGEPLPYQEIRNITSDIRSNNFELIEEITDLDSLSIGVNFDVNFIASKKNNTVINQYFDFSFINKSYAWSCDENGYLGVKDKILDLKFYSTVDYLDFPSGSEIQLENSQVLPKAELIDLLNEYLIDFRLDIVKKQVGYFDLFMSVEFESGTTKDFELVNFVWE